MTDTTNIRSHMAAVGPDTPADLKRGPTRTMHEIMVALLWVLECEQNGISYTGERGEAIREADLAKLRSLQTQLRFDTGREF